MKKHNFNAGPSVIPNKVLQEVSKDIINFNDSGLSICEVAHRSKEFTNIMDSAENDLRKLLNISDQYSVLFMAGGATGQFSAIPLNLVSSSDEALYIISGSWSKLASKEASKYCKVTEIQKDCGINELNKIIIKRKPKYVYVCTNETIDGSLFDPSDEILEKCSDTIVVADMSSEILTRKINVDNYGIIFAGAQKNMGIPGITIVIIRNNLLGKAPTSLLHCPTILDYTITSQNKSVYNTPSTLSIYMCGLMLKWSVEKGGIQFLEDNSKQRAKLIYNTLESFPSIYHIPVEKDCRSSTNIVFKLVDNKKEKEFIIEAEKLGIIGISGHRSVGGFRASLYNAISDESVECLKDYLVSFSKLSSTTT